MRGALNLTRPSRLKREHERKTERFGTDVSMILKATAGLRCRMDATPLKNMWQHSEPERCGGCYIRRREMSTFSDIRDNSLGVTQQTACSITELSMNFLKYVRDLGKKM